jgi:hypothetical protein
VKEFPRGIFRKIICPHHFPNLAHGLAPPRICAFPIGLDTTPLPSFKRKGHARAKESPRGIFRKIICHHHYFDFAHNPASLHPAFSVSFKPPELRAFGLDMSK